MKTIIKLIKVDVSVNQIVTDDRKIYTEKIEGISVG